MCKLLGISRSIVYYERKNKRQDIELENHIIRIFKESKNNYGSRKIKVELQKLGYQVSLKRIRKYSPIFYTIYRTRGKQTRRRATIRNRRK